HSSRNQSGPSATMAGTLARVSTLLASAGGTSPPGEARSAPAEYAGSSPTSVAPLRSGGARRGGGVRPATTASRAVSSPNRYSDGPSTRSMVTSDAQSAAVAAAMASRPRAISVPTAPLVAPTTRGASTARAAISAPSSTRNGLARRMARSLNEPGSPSAALTTTVVGSSLS